MTQNITIPTEDWVATPDSIQTLVNNLVGHCNQIQQSLQDAIAKEQQNSQAISNQFTECAKLCGTISARRPRTKKQAVFISDVPTTRQAKLAFGLKCNGWEIILLHREDPWFDAKLYFEETVRYTSSNHAAILASIFSPTVYHTFSGWDFETSKAILHAKPGTVIFDCYDSFGGSMKDSTSDIMKPRIDGEKFCYENSDGSTHRHANAWFMHRKLGYKISRPIFFPEYTWGGAKELQITPKPKRLDGMHCVFVGGIEPQYFNDPTKWNNVGDIQFTRSLTDRGVHYHIYPYTGYKDDARFKREYAQLFEEAEKNPFFHVHDSLPYEKMMEEITQYHFGVVTMSPEVPIEGHHYCTPMCFKSGTFNKAFDFMDAGLIMISYGWRHVERLLRGACDVVPRLEVGEFVSKMTPEQYCAQYQRRIDPVLKKLSLANQAKRLVEFYESF